MNIRMSHAAYVAVVMCVLAAQPVMAQSDKDTHETKTTARTYKRKFYDGKDADKYRAMSDMQYIESRRKDRPKGGHVDENHTAGRDEERRHMEEHSREQVVNASQQSHEDDRAERREARPVSREEENTDRAERREREERPVEAVKEEREVHDHEHANESRREYRREMRGSRKEMRRRSREDKWTHPAADSHAEKH